MFVLVLHELKDKLSGATEVVVTALTVVGIVDNGTSSSSCCFSSSKKSLISGLVTPALTLIASFISLLKRWFVA
jgi:hypothetical protein